MSRKHLTDEAEQWCRERIGQHNDNLRGWASGYLNPTEPEPEDRARTVAKLTAARDELVSLLCLFCGAVKADLQRLTLKEAMGLVVNVPEERH